jgi:hypothetical protein
MRPLQIWFPRLGGSIKLPRVGRDATRAFEHWRDEQLVWMLPEIRTPMRWRVNDTGILAVPSEEFDRIDIVQVTEQGRVYAPVANALMPATIDGLLDVWLNVQRGGGFDFIYPPTSVTVPTPDIDQATGTIGTRERIVSFGPGAYMPFSSINRESREVTMNWPPDGSPAPVSPEAESAARFPSKKLDSAPPAVITDKGDLALHVFLRWRKPLESMMPLLSSSDDILAQAQMSAIARQSAADLQGALSATTVAAQPYLSRGHSTIEHSWFRPTLEQKGIKHVLFKAQDRGLAVPGKGSRHHWDESALNQALKQQDWQKWLAEPVPIRRAWGAVGLFWTLLLDRLEAQRPFAVCERCGRIISGKAGKRFCGKVDDAECFNGRRAVDQRRSRHGR